VRGKGEVADVKQENSKQVDGDADADRSNDEFDHVNQGCVHHLTDGIIGRTHRCPTNNNHGPPS
jgi:hypothetical protein